MLRIVLSLALLSAALIWPAAVSSSPKAPQVIRPFTLIKDINTTEEVVSGMDTYPLFETVGGQVVFTAWSPQTGGELWRSDGTAKGTQLVKDINPGEGEGVQLYQPARAKLGDVLVFAADDGAVGTELWRTDGTSAGTLRLQDLWPGIESGNPNNFVVAGQRIFFTAAYSATHKALWVTDGTVTGTQQLHVFAHIPDLVNGTETMLALSNGVLLFNAAETQGNNELWRSDGTSAGTVLVQEILPGNNGSNPTRFYEIGGNGALFAALDGNTGLELWYTNGDVGNTYLVKDLAKGGNSFPQMLTTLTMTNDGNSSQRTLLTASEPNGKLGLWFTNGLPDDIFENTQKLFEGGKRNPYESQRTFVGKLQKRFDTLEYELALLALMDNRGLTQLYASDGSKVGTTKLLEIEPIVHSDTDVAQLEGQLFFPASSLNGGVELWRSDGTNGGTMPVAELKPGDLGSYPQDLTVMNGQLFFLASGDKVGRELYVTTGNGASLVADVWPGPNTGVSAILGVVNGVLYLVANDGVGGFELWKSDGTASGTVRVKDIATQPGSTYLYPIFDGRGTGNVTAAGDKLVFGTGREMYPNSAKSELAPTHTDDRIAPNGDLWVSDGTSAGTTVLKTFPSVPSGAMPYGFASLGTLGHAALFQGNEGDERYELWRTDGTLSGTYGITQVVQPNSGNLGNLMRLNDLYLFEVYTYTKDYENFGSSLWRTDGTPQGTQPVMKDLNIGAFAASGNTLFFGGRPSDDNGDFELWKTDGTAAGTLMVRDAFSDTKSSQLADLTAGAPGQVFYVVESYLGEQLWKSDGTEAGTVMVRDVITRPYSSEFTELAYANGTLLFVADDGVHGLELWKSDGTEAGTMLLTDLYPGAGSAWPRELVVLNGAVYFSATGPDGIRTLWRSDGTAAGTQPIRTDAGAPMQPEYLTVAAGQLFFSAADAAHGREAWHSDGTAAGTAMLHDLAAGEASSNPQAFVASGKHVYLTAFTEQTGREIFAARLSEVQPNPPTLTVTPPQTPPAPPRTPTVPAPVIRHKQYLPLVRR
jgi:ELWxxDGT repeat protein